MSEETKFSTAARLLGPDEHYIDHPHLDPHENFIRIRNHKLWANYEFLESVGHHTPTYSELATARELAMAALNSLFHVFHEADYYEIVLRGHTIARITCYQGSSQMRSSKTYDELPKEVQDKILDEVWKVLNNE